jgi:uncharacterized membrane-anchored protein
LPYAVTTPVFAAVVALVFWRWHRSEGTLSIHSITSRRRGTYYWSAVFATFALGTAAGDMTAMTMNLGYLDSAALFGVVIALPAIAWWRGGLNPTIAFWAAYAVTRPLGASFADWFGKPLAQTGLGLGDGTVSALALALFAVLVAYASVTKSDSLEDAGGAADRLRAALPTGVTCSVGVAGWDGAETADELVARADARSTWPRPRDATGPSSHPTRLIRSA